MLASLMLLVGCEGETGPAGPAGDSGTAGCVTCHSDDTDIVARTIQWENSTHATGGTYERNSSSCSECHTSEGFVANLETGSPGSPTNPSPVGCFTCHAPHTEGDFSLRTTSPVTLDWVGGTDVFDYEEANLCAHCHHARELDPLVTATTVIDDLRWGPHHGPQANLLAGEGAYEFSKTAAYSNSAHTTAVDNGCVACHMADPFGGQAGGHQFGVTYEYHGDEEPLISGCDVVGCHKDAAWLEEDGFNRTASGDWDGDTEIEGVQDEIAGLMDLLRAELFTRGIIDVDDYVVAGDGEGGDPPPLSLTAAEAGALLNFRYILEDGSHGFHNPAYARDMLQAALDNLP
jgi:hypothetical protein